MKADLELRASLQQFARENPHIMAEVKRWSAERERVSEFGVVLREWKRSLQRKRLRTAPMRNIIEQLGGRRVKRWQILLQKGDFVACVDGRYGQILERTASMSQFYQAVRIFGPNCAPETCIYPPWDFSKPLSTAQMSRLVDKLLPPKPTAFHKALTN